MFEAIFASLQKLGSNQYKHLKNIDLWQQPVFTLQTLRNFMSVHSLFNLSTYLMMYGVRMDKPMIIIGLGEMGSVFARGLLRNSVSIIPLNRSDSITGIAQQYPHPTGVLVSVGENDLPSVLQAIPESWKTHLVLLQNELLPRDWLRNEEYQ